MGNACYSHISNDNYAEELRTAYNVIMHQREQSVPKSGKVRVLSYNCFIRPPMVSGPNDDYKDQRLEEFTKAFSQYDIICLQEVFGSWSNRRSNFIQKAKEAGFIHNAVAPRPNTLSSYAIDGGLVILSRFPIIASEFRVLSQGVGVDAFCNKGALYVKIRIGDSKLHLYTIHTQATYDETPKYFLKRSEQLIDFHKFIQETLEKYEHQNEDLVLLTGDFNVDSRSQRQFGSDNATLAPIIEKYNSLKKPGAFTEYDGLISCLTDDFRDEVEDLLYKKHKDHPITFGEYYLNENNEKVPVDGVLTDKDCRCVAESLDYIFKFTPRGTLETDLALKQKLAIVEDSVAVEEFFVKGFEFGQLSDHYGVEVTLKYYPTSDTDKEDAETAIGSVTYQQEIMCR